MKRRKGYNYEEDEEKREEVELEEEEEKWRMRRSRTSWRRKGVDVRMMRTIRRNRRRYE